MTATPRRSEKLDLRLTPQAKRRLTAAAESVQRSVSDFVVAAAHDAAQRAIEEAQLIRLSVEEQRRFVDLLLNPPAPAAALRRARKAHAKLIAE